MDQAFGHPLMSNRVLVVAPHPDDETLGCGGTLLRMAREGAHVGWFIVTGMNEDAGFSGEAIEAREDEIRRVTELYGFAEVFRLGLPTCQLDTLPMADLIDQFAAVFKSFQPEIVFLPHRMDVHTDHRVVFEASASCAKWFRYGSVRRVLAYETLSETEFNVDVRSAFQPNYFVDISEFLERKLEIMAVYQSELDRFPFPRSLEAIRALATFRGANSGFRAAEAFQLLRERY
jgi:LmbE family N-acetylglucosaminyl deacetylase